MLDCCIAPGNLLYSDVSSPDEADVGSLTLRSECAGGGPGDWVPALTSDVPSVHSLLASALWETQRVQADIQFSN